MASSRTRPSGARAVVVGNGSSVAATPPAAWAAFSSEGKLLIGTNRVLAMRCLQGVPWDALVIRDTYRALWKDPDTGWRYDRTLWQHHPAWRVGPAEERISRCDEFVRQVPGWQYTDVRVGGESAVALNASVVIMACNWAWLCGVRHFELVGVDYAPGTIEWLDGYNESQGADGRYDGPVPDSVERQFAELRAAVEHGGGTVVNLSRGTRLKAIEYADRFGGDARPVEQAGGAVEGHSARPRRTRSRGHRHRPDVADHQRQD